MCSPGAEAMLGDGIEPRRDLLPDPQPLRPVRSNRRPFRVGTESAQADRCCTHELQRSTSGRVMFCAQQTISAYMCYGSTGLRFCGAGPWRFGRPSATAIPSRLVRWTARQTEKASPSYQVGEMAKRVVEKLRHGLLPASHPAGPRPHDAEDRRRARPGHRDVHHPCAPNRRTPFSSAQVNGGFFWFGRFVAPHSLMASQVLRSTASKGSSG